MSCCAVPVVSGWQVLRTALTGLWRKKQTKREISLLDCAFGPFLSKFGPPRHRLLSCSSCTCRPRRPLFVSLPSPKSSDATQPHTRLCPSTSSFRNRCPHFPGSKDRECESLNSAISSLGRTRKRSKEALCHPERHTA